MTRSKRMQSVVEVTANNERESARVLAELQKRVLAAEQRYQELIRYRDDYTQQFASGGSLSVARLQDYRIFLGRLNQAVEQQQQLVERAQQDCAKQKREVRGWGGKVNEPGKNKSCPKCNPEDAVKLPHILLKQIHLIHH